MTAAYVVKVATKIAGRFRYLVTSASFACTRQELPREIATRCGVRLIDVVEYRAYSTREAAETIATYEAF